MGQNHGCCWPGPLRHQVISSIGNECVRWAGPCLLWITVLVLRDDRKGIGLARNRCQAITWTNMLLILMMLCWVFSTIPADTLRNNDVVIRSKWRRFDVITTLLLRHVFDGKRYRRAWRRHQMETFPRYSPFVRGTHRSTAVPLTKASDMELFFLWSAPEQTVK